MEENFSRVDAGLTISNGYVVYERGIRSNSSYWRWIHRKAMLDAEKLSGDINIPYDFYEVRRAGEELIQRGLEERAKEKQILFQCLGVQYGEDFNTFGQSFHELVNQKNQLHTALTQLKELSNQKRGVADNRKFSSYFVNAFGTSLTAKLKELLSEIGERITTDNFSTYEYRVEELARKSLDEALEIAIDRAANTEGGDYYQRLQQVLQIFPSFHAEFRRALETHVDISKLQTVLTSNQGDQRKGLRRAIDSAGGLNLKNKRNTTYFAKSVQEVAEQIIRDVGTSLQSSQGKNVNISLPSTFSMFSTEQYMDFDFLDNLDFNLQDDSILITAVRELETYYSQYLSKLDDSLVVYRSFSPTRQLDSLMQFGGPSELEDLHIALERARTIDYQKIKKLIQVALNTGTGAYFEERQSEAYVNLEIALLDAVANLLLLDWDIRGRFYSSNQQIFVIEFAGHNILLSTLYTAIGRALQAVGANENLLVNIDINMPSVINHMEPIITTSDSPLQEIIDEWNKQADNTREETTFAIHFLQEFENIVSQYLNGQF